jgi:hypothetical protein
MANRFAEIEREEETKVKPAVGSLGVVPVPAADAPAPRNRFAVIEEEEERKAPAPAPTPAAPAPVAKAEPSLGQKALSLGKMSEDLLARKGLGAATAITEIVPGAQQAVAGLRSAFGDQSYEDELARVREEQQMMRKLEPATTGITRGAGNVALSAPAVALGGPLGLAALTGAQALSRGTGVGQAALEAGIGGLAGPVLSRAPAAVQAVAPVVATAGGMLGAKDQSALWEAITGLAPAAAAAISQGVRGAYRGLTGRAEKAEKQLLSTKGAELSGMREEELAEKAKAVASKLGERRALTGEQQSRLSKMLELLRLGKQAGMEGLPSEESLMMADGGWSQEALDEAQKAVRSFLVNSPEKFTSEPKRIAAALEEAIAAEAAAQAKWSDPLAVARGIQPVGPVTPGPVSPELEAAARLLQQRELAAARTRVPEEIKGAAKERVIASMLGGIPFGLATDASAAGAAKGMLAGAAGRAMYGSARKVQQLLAVDPKTKLFKDPAAANVIYDVIPSVARKFPTMQKYLSLATDAGIRARPVFLLEALRRDPDLARAVEEEVTGEVTPE